MKRSKKYVKKLKSRIQVSTLCIATILMLIAIGKLAGISVPINTAKDIAQTNPLAEESTALEGEEIIENRESTESTQSSKVRIAEDGAIVCDSIVQGVRDSELENGTYTFRVTGNINGTNETKDYKVELINYYDDVTYTANTNLGDSTKEYKMLVVKYHKNLTINSGVYVTATTVSSLTYKKGMYLCVMGELKNYGTISMTSRGTYNCAGENVYLWKNSDDSYEYVPAVGGAGGRGVTASCSNYKNSIVNGNRGASGTKRGTAGGGAGGATASSSGWATSGSGGNGSSYSGGSGAGGAVSRTKGVSSGNGSSVGGPGGAAGVSRR